MLSYATINNLRHTSETPFSFFRQIASRSSRVNDYDRDVLEKYLTYGIFLFDPDKYENLYRVINDDYIFTNGCTGEFFYLWTLVSPQISLDQGHFENNRDTRPWRKTPKVYDSLFTAACARALGLKHCNSPILVLTGNLNSKRILVVEIDDLFIENTSRLQVLFRKISELASHDCCADGKEKLRRLKEIVERFDLRCYAHSIKGATFAKTMTTVFANLVQSPDYQRAARLDPEDFREATKEADKSFNLLQRQILNLRQDLAEIDETAEFDKFVECRNIYEEICLKQLMFAAVRAGEMTNLERFGLSPDMPKFLLPSSREFLTSATRALAAREVFHGDESSIAICFAKLFENEINNSVVQEMRQCCGVSMPAFFGKYDSGKGECFVENRDMRINLNSCDSSENWLPPELGRSRLIYKTQRMCLSNNEGFIKLWGDIARKRNVCAHAGHSEEQREVLERMLELFHEMDASSFWEKMHLLRERIIKGPQTSR